MKRELERLGLDYDVVDADADGRDEVIQLSGQRAIPILTIGDEVFVDSSHIIRELRSRYALSTCEVILDVVPSDSPPNCSRAYSA